MLATTVLILLSPAWLALGIIWSIAIVRQLREWRKVPSLRAGIAMADAAPPAERVTAIIPAHNEAGSIGAAIASLRAQRGVDLRVVIALDRCTDGTRAAAEAAIAGDPRFGIIDIGPCPPGWPGKVNALWQAATASAARRDRGSDASPTAETDEDEVLLFLDADVTLEPDCIRAALALRRERGLEVVTALSTLRHHHWFEQLIQPACVLELTYEFPLHKMNARPGERGARPFVNGQFVLIGRAAYDALGGHAVLAAEVTEDLALGRVAWNAGLAMGAFPSDGLMTAAMYDSWESFQRGWMRIYLGGSGRKVRRLRKWAWRLWLACAALPLLVTATAVLAAMTPEAAGWARTLAGVGSGVALALWGGFISWAYARLRAPWWSVPAHPVAMGIVGCIQWRAARTLAGRGAIEWAGKAYVFEPR